MSLVAVEIAAPSHLRGAWTGDVDGDGVDELILSATTAAGAEPDRLTLHVYRFDRAGAVVGSSRVELGNRPALWTAFRGLWVIDGDGVQRADPLSGALTRVWTGRTVLAGLGAATPTWADFAADLEDDGVPEILVATPGKLVGVRPDGSSLGSVALRNEATLGAGDRLGGSGLALTSHPASWIVADLDGDGVKDLLFPSHKSLAAYYNGESLGQRSATVALPMDVEPPEERFQPGVETRNLSRVWLTDLDGDKKADFLAHRFITKGGFFGATAEVLWALGHGSGYGPLITIRTPSAALGVEPRDLDGDGDQEILTRDVDVGFGNVARAVLAKSVQVSLTRFEMGNRAYPLTGFAIRRFAWPIDPPNRYQEVFDADVDGDGRLDLVCNDALDAVRVYRGRPGGLDTGFAHELALRVPLADGALITGDLNGDGRAEIVVWGPEERSVQVLRVQ